ncbi:alpha/beta fold hydrolase [Sabulicella glaciei]|uniref:Alpha/beta hydrolase n=1 Tax=Sabulicella glaciei TaxID=2984948 RepID=A0ABT3NWY8_9PROT|nr:alpha/beta fold hydrolase [Roseococcus sp. MDT2-1-1]MCW8086079.1 alpha/beta hydrolase [Roseococcus sp. MDT2-1-1]
MAEPRLGQMNASFGEGSVVLRWWEWGPADGLPVVCVHGLTRNGRDFDVLARDLAARGRRVLCVDVPGRGVSGWLPRPELYAVPVYAQCLAPLVAALGRHDWVGTSMGGLIGMAMAALPHATMRRFVVNDIGPFVPAAAIGRIQAYMAGAPTEFADAAALEAYLRRVHAPFGALSDAEWAHLARHSARVAPDGRTVLHYDPAIGGPMMAGDPADIELWPLWEAASARPTLVLRGEASDLLLPETAVRMAARVRVETIPGCGHAPALMEASQVALVADFLS